MKDFLNKPLSERYRYLGNTDQLYSVDKITYEEGKRRGCQVFDVKNGGGLNFKVNIDNALDIAEVSYKGIPISYLSKNGFNSPYNYIPVETNFQSTFPGGMLYTCGLMTTGPACYDRGKFQPIHGKINAIPADRVSSTINDEKEIVINGRIKETQLCGHSLELLRTIKCNVGENKIVLTDVLTNKCETDEKFNIIYHMNFGFPFICEDTKLVVPENTVITPRDAEAEKGVGSELEFSKPIDNYLEQVFFHDVPAENGMSSVCLENKKLGVGVKVSWSKDTLPRAAEWKNMRSSEYVVAIEPTNGFIKGRYEEKKNQSIQTIKAFESITMQVSLEFYDL